MEPQPLNQSPLASLATLHNNPFLFAPLFETFYRELGKKERSILLAYLVLPLVLPEFSRDALSRTTSILTFARKQDRTLGLAARIAERKMETNLALQQNIDRGVLAFEDPTTLVFTRSSKGNEKLHCPESMLKAARKFGKICAPHSIPAIYLQLGIKKL